MKIFLIIALGLLALLFYIWIMIFNNNNERIIEYITVFAGVILGGLLTFSFTVLNKLETKEFNFEHKVLTFEKEGKEYLHNFSFYDVLREKYYYHVKVNNEKVENLELQKDNHLKTIRNIFLSYMLDIFNKNNGNSEFYDAALINPDLINEIIEKNGRGKAGWKLSSPKNTLIESIVGNKFAKIIISKKAYRIFYDYKIVITIRASEYHARTDYELGKYLKIYKPKKANNILGNIQDIPVNDENVTRIYSVNTIYERGKFRPLSNIGIKYDKWSMSLINDFINKFDKKTLSEALENYIQSSVMDKLFHETK